MSLCMEIYNIKYNSCNSGMFQNSTYNGINVNMVWIPTKYLNNVIYAMFLEKLVKCQHTISISYWKINY